MQYNNYINLCNYYEKTFDNLNTNLKNLLSLFFNKDKFLQILKPKFESQKKDLH